MKTTMLIPDLQMPYHDGLMLRKAISVVEALQPDKIVQIGDLPDLPQPAHWNKGGRGEYEMTLQDHIDCVKDEFFAPLRKAAPKAAVLWVQGNHDKRLKDYKAKYTPAVTSLRSYKTLMQDEFELEKFGVKYVEGPLIVAPHTKALHGHECRGYSANLSAWDKKFKDRYGSQYNYVFGHTHTPGIVTRAFGEKGNLNPRWTMNIGSMMDIRHAEYLGDGSADWTMSFGVLRDDGKRVYPELVTAVDRGFMFEGRKW